MEKLVRLDMEIIWEGELSAIDAAEAHHPICESPAIACVISSPCSPMKTVPPGEMSLIAPLAGPMKKTRMKTNRIRKCGNGIAINILSLSDYLNISSAGTISIGCD
jgi:hypothetical protein